MSEPTEELLSFPRLDSELMSKKDIQQHIVQQHGISYINGYYIAGSSPKMTKVQLIEWHEKQHEHLDEYRVAGEGHKDFVVEPGWGSNSGRVSKRQDDRRGYEWVAWIPKVPHTHDSIVAEATDEQQAQVSRARNNEPVSNKPLSVQERKVLKELVDNDFNSLKSEMKQFAADSLAAAKREIEAEWADKVKEAPVFGTRYTELVRKQEAEKAELKARHEDEQKALRDEAAAAGVEITSGRYDSSGAYLVHGTEVKGMKDAITRAEAENKAMLERALLTLERQRLTAQRQVLVSGVSREAATILDTVPEAKTLMVEAQRAQAEITAG